MDELFRLAGFGFTYPQQRRPALTGIDLTVRPGEFWVLCGPSGCGKSTLLRQLKTVLAPHGTTEGEVYFQGTPLRDVPLRQQAADIGFVLQSPEHQVVTDKVWHELAFGLESMGCDTPAIRRRVAEMASFFGIQGWFHKSVDQLSGGQKQLLSLASVMVMQPRVLILDEPTSQLDPIAAADFLQTLGRINRELGTTVLLTEHRLEDALPLATHAAVLDGGRLLCTGTPSEVGRQLRGRGHGMFLAMPAAMRIWASVRSDDPAPVTVREGRDFLRRWQAAHSLCPLPPAQEHPRGGPVLTAEGLWFRYAPEEPDVVRGLDLTVYQGELLALLGGNGAGKTTSLHLLSGALTPYRGTVRHTGRIGVLPQDPQALFVKKTVRQDLYEAFDGQTLPSDLREKRVAQAVSLCRLTELLDRHPYDLSGGEQQRAALCKVLLLDPEILLLDEASSQLDPLSAQNFVDAVRRINQDIGVTVIAAEHRLEELLPISDRVIVLDGGRIIADCPPGLLADALPENHPMSRALTASQRVFRSAGGRGASPVSIREGRQNELCREYLRTHAENSPQEFTPPGDPLLTVKELHAGWGKTAPDVLRGASLKLYPGEIYAVIGGNGSGKSTLLKTISGILKPTGGRVKMRRNAVTAYLPQEPCLLFSKETVGEEAPREMLERFALDGLSDRDPLDLSGGERQKLALAKLLAGKPDILLLDDATSALDFKTESAFRQALREQSKATTTIIIAQRISAVMHCDQILVMEDGEMLGLGTHEELMQSCPLYQEIAALQIGGEAQ